MKSGVRTTTRTGTTCAENEVIGPISSKNASLRPYLCVDWKGAVAPSKQGSAATPTALAGGRDNDQRSATSNGRLCRGFAQTLGSRPESKSVKGIDDEEPEKNVMAQRRPQPAKAKERTSVMATMHSLKADKADCDRPALQPLAAVHDQHVATISRDLLDTNRQGLRAQSSTSPPRIFLVVPTRFPRRGEARRRHEVAEASGVQQGCAECRRFPLRAYNRRTSRPVHTDSALSLGRSPLSLGNRQSSSWSATLRWPPVRCAVGRSTSGRPPPGVLRWSFCPAGMCWTRELKWTLVKHVGTRG